MVRMSDQDPPEQLNQEPLEAETDKLTPRDKIWLNTINDRFGNDIRGAVGFLDMILADPSLTDRQRESLKFAHQSMKDLQSNLGQFRKMKRFKTHAPKGTSHAIIDFETSSEDPDNPQLS